MNNSNELMKPILKSPLKNHDEDNINLILPYGNPLNEINIIMDDITNVALFSINDKFDSLSDHDKVIVSGVIGYITDNINILNDKKLSISMKYVMEYPDIGKEWYDMLCNCSIDKSKLASEYTNEIDDHISSLLDDFNKTDEVWKIITKINVNTRTIEDTNYEVSNRGKVRHRITGNLLNHNQNGRIALYHDKEGYSVNIKMLVADTFVDNPNNKSRVKFIDGDTNNLNSSNLMWY